MITENLSTLKIHKLTQAQYDRELEAGNLDETALYLTPDEEVEIPIPTAEDEGKVLAVEDGVPEWVGTTMTKYADIPEDSLTEGYIHVTGEWRGSDSWQATDFLPLADYEKGNYIYAHCTIYGNGSIAFYDSDKAFISSVSGNTAADNGFTSDIDMQTLKIIPPENASYVRISKFIRPYNSSFPLELYGIANVAVRDAIEAKLDKRFPYTDLGKPLVVGGDGNVMAGGGSFTLVCDITTTEEVNEITFSDLNDSKVLVVLDIPASDNDNAVGVILFSGAAAVYSSALRKNGQRRICYIRAYTDSGLLTVPYAKIYPATSTVHGEDFLYYPKANGGEFLNTIYSVGAKFVSTTEMFPIGTNLKVYVPREG